MKLYILTSIDPNFRKEFCHQTRIQNFKVVQFIALFSVVAGIVWRVFSSTSNYQANFVNYHAFSIINAYFVGLSIIFAFVIYIMRKKIEPRNLVRYHFIVWLYSLLFILKNIAFSFLAQSTPNPSNTLAMLMVGLFVIASVLVYSTKETFAIEVISFVVFMSGMFFLQVDNTIWITNITAFCMLLIVYFVISRILYTYHCNYFKKVKIIEAKNEQIELANQSKNELLSMVAHDLRSPLNNIQSLVEIMQMPGQENEQAAYFQYIKDCCVKADGIIREIVTAAQEENTPLLHKTNEHLNMLLQDAYRNWKRIVSNKVELALVLPEEWIVLAVNKNKIQRIIDNLIGNAIKFTPEKNGRIEIELRRIDNKVRISVSDNGIGIPQEYLPYLFDKFTPAGRKGLHEEDSTGLGLHISKQLAEQHGGMLWVESEEQKGSTFYLDLPA
jgi:signal transduction histidine kinase